MSLPRFAFALTVLAGAASAQPIQPISAEFFPNPAVLGGTSNVSIFLFNNSGQVVSHGVCTWYAIHRSLPNGQPDTSTSGMIVPPPVPCTLQIVFTPSGQQIGQGTAVESWNLTDNGSTVPPGVYWVRSNVQPLQDQWFPLSVIQGGDTKMSITTQARVNQMASWKIEADVAHAQAPLVIVLSFSANNPIGSFPPLGLNIPLSPPLLDISGPITLNMQGNKNFSLQIPNQPFLANDGFFVQGIFANQLAGPPLVTTNAVCNIIRP